MIAPLLGVLLLAAPARAMTPQEQSVIEAGIAALYRGDDDGAERLFDESMRRAPGDPVYSLGYATTVWWRLESDFALPDAPEEQRFFAAVGRAVDDAKRATRSGDDRARAEAYLYLGAAQGLKGRREASGHRWLAAYFDGRRSYRNERRAVKLDAELYDAYLGIGAFDYYVATLSRFLRVLAFASGGDKSKGLDELRLAAERGRFSRVAAKLLIVGIDWTFEKKPRDAWALLDEIHHEYPGSPMVDAMRLAGLYHLRDADGLKREARAFLSKAESGAPFYRPLDRAGGRYFLGLGEQLAGEYQPAIEQYEAAFQDVPEGHRLRGLLRLFIGESLDLMGRRKDAVASYRRAIAAPPMWGVQRYARHLLTHPFRAGADPLPPRGADLG